MLVNITIDENNIITGYNSVPFSYDKPIIEVENISTIHVGYSMAVNPIETSFKKNKKEGVYNLYTLIENKESYEIAIKEKKNALKEKKYNSLVSKYIREKYNQDKVEAIINNYLYDNTNEDYIAEFQELQSYRKECKEKAYLEIYGE